MKQTYVLTGYVGGKAALSSEIKALFDPNCTEYVEPFAGGAAVYFFMPNGHYNKEWLNDRNPNIAILYHALSNAELREETASRILALDKPDDEMEAKAQFDRAKKDLLDIEKCNVIEEGKLEKEEIINIAVSTFLVYSLSFNKSGNGFSSSESSNRYSWNTRERLENSMDRLRTLGKVTNIDSIIVIREKQDDPSVQLYVDPPYIGVCRANKGKNYAVDMIDLKSHYELACCVRDAKAAVVLSGYRAPQDGVPTIYDAVLGEGWHCFSIGNVKNNAVKSEIGTKKSDVVEYVWTNRVPDDARFWVSMEDFMEHLNMEDYFRRINEAITDGRITDPRDIQDYEAFDRWYQSEERRKTVEGGLKV